MIRNMVALKNGLVERARVLGEGCEKVFCSISGGIDSSTTVAILCLAFGPENVVALYRDIKSAPHHHEDVLWMQKHFGFTLIDIDANPLYDMLISLLKDEFQKNGLHWQDENTSEADEDGYHNAYKSLKSRLTTPIAGFISKAIDQGKGRIFGTGNGEEDGLLRYFDKYGDGAVDNNILSCLTKAEVRQLATFLGIDQRIVQKTPSADLAGNGDLHNDESELTAWAKRLGYDIEISYGSPDGSKEGNLAWAWKQDLNYGVITGNASDMYADDLALRFQYTHEQIKLILFLRQAEKTTRHKIEPPQGIERRYLRFDIVD